MLPKTAENSSIYWKALPLRISQNRYRLDVVVEGCERRPQRLLEPRHRRSRFQRGPPQQLLAYHRRSDGDGRSQERWHGNFVMGTTKVRPRVQSADGKPVSFKRNQKLNFWMQVYNLSVDEKTHKPSATVEYNVTDANNKAVIHTVESTDTMGNIGDQVTLQKTLSAANLQPGTYKIEIKVNDRLSKQTVDPTATFSVASRTTLFKAAAGHLPVVQSGGRDDQKARVPRDRPAPGVSGLVCFAVRHDLRLRPRLQRCSANGRRR